MHLLKIILILCFFVSFVWLCRALLLDNYPDFTTQYHASEKLLSGENTYEGGEGLFTPQVYPPTISILYYPLTFLSIQDAQLLFTFISIVLLIHSLYYLSKIFEVKFWSNLNLLFCIFAFTAFPTKFSLGMGQINILILWLMVNGLWLIKRRKDILSGAFFGLAFALKLFPILIFPFFVFLKRKIFFGSALSVTAGLILVIFLTPINLFYDFLFTTLPETASSWKTDYYNQSLSGVIGRSFGVGTFSSSIRLITSVLLVLISYIVLFRSDRKRKDFALHSISFLITLNLLINSFSWQHHFVWILIPLYATNIWIFKNKTKLLEKTLLTSCFFLIAINLADPSIIPILFQSHVFFGALLLWIMQIKILTTKENDVL